MNSVAENNILKTDVLVVGSGIAGLQSSLDIADQGFDVVVVEKSASIGGRMINLSKVFPTLDCASCITTPRMASTAHHDNIKVMTYSDIKHIEKIDNRFKVDVIKKPRYIIEEDCIGCKKCEESCPMLLSDDFEHGLGARKAIYIPFTNAIPQYPILDMDNCIMCGACAKECPTKCINYIQEPENVTIDAGSIILATGFELTSISAKKRYGEGNLMNVISPFQMERLLAPHGPYGGIYRPSDGKIPDSIAYVQCAGSRDKSIGVPYCSRVCCMYAIKQAMLLSGSLPIADITIYYMDIRAFGKGYEQFYQNAKAMGIQFVKAKVAKITEDDEHNPIVRIEEQENLSQPQERAHDLVVLSLGMLPNSISQDIIDLEKDTDGFVKSVKSKISPTLTSIEGVFCAGTAIGPKDIVDTILDASSSAQEAINYIRSYK